MLAASESQATLAQPRRIAVGDLVIVYMSHDNMKAVTVAAKGCFNSAVGTFRVAEWVGKPFGSKVFSPQGAWVHLLRPTPELWTQVLRHRTQIIYVADVSQICAGLDLRAGHVVLESGTGSGSLTTSLARAVAPDGRVRTFEFHRGRHEAAAAEFAANGLAPIVEGAVRDVEADGFPEACHGAADAIVLDVPAPYKVADSVSACLRPGGRFCAFSPCVEQVQRTAAALRARDFTDLRCLECLLRHYAVRSEARLAAELPGECQAEAGPQERGAGDADSAAAPEAEQGGAPAGVVDGEAAVGDKRKRSGASTGAQDVGGKGGGKRLVAIPSMQAKGHTGYLLFARKLVPAVAEGASV